LVVKRRSVGLGVAAALFVALASPALAEDHSPIYLTIAPDGTLSFDGHALAETDLHDAASAARARRGADVRIVIAADASTRHATVVHVIDILRDAGITRVSIAVAPDRAPTP
jgi:biopolymer transport protein ExbD